MVERRISERLEPSEGSRAPQAAQFPATRRSRRASPIKAKPKISELSLHTSVAHMLDWLLMPPAVYTTFPAGWGKMSPAMAGMLHRCGLKRGMPDIMIFHDGRCLGIELKTPGRAQSSAQRDMAAKLQGAGVTVYVCRSQEEVTRLLMVCRIPTRKMRYT